jgi:hypothetical protein
MQSLPVSRLVNVTVNLTPSLAQFPNLSTALILGTSDVIDPVTRMVRYGSIEEVAAAFGTTAQEYLASVLWFEQQPQPTNILIGRWVNVASAGQLYGGPVLAADRVVGPWNAINNGAFKVGVDGVAATEIGNLDFSAAANMNAVAAIIESGFPGGTATVVWDAANFRFVITSVATGDGSAISFLTAPDLGTDISGMMAGLSTSSGAYESPGLDPQTAVDTVAIFMDRFSTQWYGLVVPSASEADILSISALIEASSAPHFHGATTTDAATLLSTSTDDLASEMKALGFKKSAVQYSSTNPYAVVSMLSRILTTNWQAQNSTITLMYKQEPGITAEQLSEAQAAVLDSKNCNVFAAYNNDTAIIQTGITPSGQFIDTVVGVDWLRGAIQTNVYNLLYGANKIPQSDPGMHQIATQIEAACQQGVFNGLLAPGVWNAGGFGQLVQGDYLSKGYYVYAPPIGQQSQSDRTARISVPFKVAAKLAGAVHTVDVLVDVNP